MPTAWSSRTAGIVLVAAAAISWSTAPLFVRLLPFDAFTILFWRGVFAGFAILLFLALLQGVSALKDIVRMSRGGLIFAAVSALGMLLFIPSLKLTSVANVAIILTAVPFAAAALAWVWFREVPRPRTILLGVFAALGIAISVGGATAADFGGIVLSIIMMLAIAGMTVTARRYRETPLIAAAALSNFMGSAVSLPLAQAVLNVPAYDMLVLLAFGVCQVALGLTFFAIGSRHLPVAQTALIATLETPLMPFWIWVAFGEFPAASQLIGGAMVLAAVFGDTLGDLVRERPAHEPVG